MSITSGRGSDGFTNLNDGTPRTNAGFRTVQVLIKAFDGFQNPIDGRIAGHIIGG